MFCRRSLFLAVSVITLAGFQGFAEAETSTAAVSSRDQSNYVSGMTDRLKQDLGLSDDQAAKIKDIFSSSSAASSNTFEQQRQAYIEQRKAERAQIQDKINSVLTDEQKQKYAQIQQDRQNRRGGEGRGYNHDGGRKNWKGQDGGKHDQGHDGWRGKPGWDRGGNPGDGWQGHGHHHQRSERNENQ